jgi:hypothetical protein
MGDLVFLVGQATFTTPIDQLVANCTFFQTHPELTSTPYRVRSPISADVFALFVRSLSNGGTRSSEVNRLNAVGLSMLCGEFGFWSFAATLSALEKDRGLFEVEEGL